MNVTFEYGSGGGYPVEFIVKYKEKGIKLDHRTICNSVALGIGSEQRGGLGETMKANLLRWEARER